MAKDGMASRSQAPDLRIRTIAGLLLALVAAPAFWALYLHLHRAKGWLGQADWPVLVVTVLIGIVGLSLTSLRYTTKATVIAFYGAFATVGLIVWLVAFRL